MIRPGLKRGLSVGGLLILFAVRTSAAVGQDSPASDAELDALAREAVAVCPVTDRPPVGYSLINHAEWLAGLHYRVHVACPRHPPLALRIARRMAATPSPWTALAHKLMAELYERGIGVRADPAMALDYRRRTWLLGPPSGFEDPFAGEADRDSYLARPETIAFLRRYDSPDLPLARVNLVRALLARNAAGDRAEAARILEYPSFGGSDEGRLVRARFRLQEAADADARSPVIAELRSLSRSSPEARTLLAEVARRQLADASSEAQGWDAIALLAVAAYALEPAAVTELMDAVEHANGGRPPTILTGPELSAIQDLLRAPMSNEDYPSRALRDEAQGRIALRGLIDPEGRLIFTEPLLPNQNPALLGAVRRIYAYRRTPQVDLGAARTAPYMWVELPGVVFVITT